MKKTSTGVFRVERDCCTSGNCFKCTRRTPFGKPMRIMHTETHDAKQAATIAENWKQYNATVIKE